MVSKGNKFILEKFLSKAQEGMTVPEGENIKITYPNGTTKIVNTGSSEYAQMYKKGQIQDPKNMANGIFFGGELDEIVVKGKVSELGKLRNQYSEKNTREDFINKKKDEYIKKLGKSNWYGIDRNNFPEKVLAEINQNYDYNKNTYALQQLAKKRKINLNERGAWVDNLTSQEKNALINSKYSAQLNPNEFVNTLSGVQELANTLLPGRPFDFNISGLTPKERKEDAEAKLSGLKVFSLLNTPGNMIANAAKNNTTSSYGNFREQPILGSQRMGNVSEIESAALNPLTYEAVASLPKLAQSGYKFLKNVPKNVKNLPETFNSLQQVAKKTFTPSREADLSNIERLSGQLRESSTSDIEAVRRAFHNSERYLTRDELDLLRVQGRGAAEDYRLPPPPGIESMQAGLTGVPDTQTTFNYTSEEALNRLNAGMNLEPEHVQVLGREYNANNLSLADSDAFGRYVIGNRGRIDLRRGAASNADNTNSAGRTYQLDDVYPPSDPNWNTPNFVVRNRSGFKKEDLIAKADDAEKELLTNMSDDDFAKTVTKPSGQTVSYVDGPSISQMTYNTDHGRMIHSDATPMSSEEYAQVFNDNVDRLNEIIKLNNKSGVEYQVEKLFPNGQLKFVTPEQTLRVPNTNRNAFKIEDVSNQFNEPAYSVKYPDPQDPQTLTYDIFKTKEEAQAFTDKLNANQPEFVDVKIDAGSSQWDTPINAGRWEGEVEDIANKEYYKSIPGLNMSVTSNTVFADRMPRLGTGTYKSINEFLKELNLGRVKPGFNSQTTSSFNTWDKSAKKGQAVGYYYDPSLFYGTMKKEGGSDIPPIRQAVMSDFEKFQLNYLNENKNQIQNLIDNQSITQEEATIMYNNILDEIERQRNENTPDDIVQFPLNIRNEFGNYEIPQQELGGMLYANVNAGLPHEQSMAKYLGPEKSVLEFMQRKKVVGGSVPFDEYYRENIINPRNKS